MVLSVGIVVENPEGIRIADDAIDLAFPGRALSVVCADGTVVNLNLTLSVDLER